MGVHYEPLLPSFSKTGKMQGWRTFNFGNEPSYSAGGLNKGLACCSPAHSIQMSYPCGAMCPMPAEWAMRAAIEQDITYCVVYRNNLNTLSLFMTVLPGMKLAVFTVYKPIVESCR